MKNKRSFYITFLLLIAAFITIGYAALSQSLRVTGSAGIASNSWIIYFNNLLERPGSLEATSPAKINTTKDRIDFGISLTEPGEQYIFETDIVNDGTIDAMIDSVTLSGIPSTLDNVIQWEVKYLDGSDLQKCDELLSSSKRRIRVTVEYNKDIDKLPAAQDLTLSLVVNYIQLDNKVCQTTIPAGDEPVDPLDGRHTLTIDPNYGVYEESDAVKTIRMVPGEVYVLSTPVQEVHTFNGWTIDKEDTFDETSGIITMGDEDINAIAEWEWIITDEENNMGYCFSVGDNYFYNFDEAISAAGSKGTIKLLSNGCVIKNRSTVYDDFKIGENPYKNESLKYATQDVDITFDLNGHKVDWISSLFNFAKFTIEDKSDSKNGEIIRPPKENNSVFENGMIINNNLAYARGVTTTFNDIKITDNRYGNIVRAQYDCIVRINGGTYTTNSGINNAGTLVYSTGDNNEIYIYDSVVNVNTNSSALWVNDGYVEIDGLEINAKYSSGGYSGLIYFNNGIDDYSIKNLDINMVWDGGTGYGMWLVPGDENDIFNLENVNIKISGTSMGMPVGVYIAGGNSTFNFIDSSIDLDIVGKGLVTSVYDGWGSTINFDNVDVNIKYLGGDYVYGVYVMDLVYNEGSVNVDVQNANTVYCVQGFKSVINNVIVNCNVANSVSNIYGFDARTSLVLTNSEINMDVNAVTSVYRIVDCSSCDVDNLGINTSLNNSGASGAFQGLSFENVNNYDRIFKNIDFKATLKNSAQYTRLLNGDGATFENLNVILNIPSSNHSGKNAGFYLNNSTLKHSSLKVNNESSSYFYGVECSSCVIDDADIDIDNNTAGGNPIYGFNGSDMDIKNSKLKISNNGNVQIYGLYSSNASSLNSSFIDIKSSGNSPSYGISGKDITSNNNDIKIELLNVNAPLYGYILSGDSNITGGKIDVIGPDYPYENLGLMKSLNAVQSSDSLNISDYTINSKYSCVNFTGSTLTTNGVNMTCGGYGIQKGSESVVNSTETVVNAELE